MGGLVEQLNQRRQAALKRPKILDREIPGYGVTPTSSSSMLVARYKPLAWDKFAQSIDRSAEAEETGDAFAELDANLDAIIEACDRLMVRTEDGDLVSLADKVREEGGEVNTETGEIRFDHEAARVLGVEVAGDLDARKVTLAIFDGAVSPEAAIQRHATSLALWMRGVSQEVDTRLGEDLPATQTLS